ncbi:MAG TPA: hypothetical protein PLM53_17560 [Spirochaetota bacterium]|nr:hypothetical protein [Spirochaetota bacterium]HQF09757.1 hypothetical protein [Spirochaetota bacterium]HQH98906.1 hypothetical protein [Spirochaetota bacterium]HQJ71826.1 hypothetical protein [Spirochaetota bacterium]HRS77752.1 hypothetical protein [Spirochaetota bacterium]
MMRKMVIFFTCCLCFGLVLACETKDDKNSLMDSLVSGGSMGTGDNGDSGCSGDTGNNAGDGSSGSVDRTDWPVSPLDGVVVIPETERVVVKDKRYPVILVPGWAGTEKFMNSIDYFWQLKGALSDAGRETYVADLNCFSTHHVRAAELRDFMYELLYRKVREIAAARGIASRDVDMSDLKFNLLCHSQGGINARYMVKVLSMADPRYDDASMAPLIPASRFVASIVMISTPNNGTYLAQWAVETKPLDAIGKWVFENIWAGLLAGQSGSDYIAATTNCSEPYMSETFNPLLEKIGRGTPHIRVYTYSATVPAASVNLNALIIFPLWSIINSDPKYHGSNPSDGVTPRQSAEWAPGSGEQYGTWRFVEHLQGYLPIIGKVGVDHWMLVNQLMGFHPGFDAKKFYRDIVTMLETEGM